MNVFFKSNKKTTVYIIQFDKRKIRKNKLFALRKNHISDSGLLKQHWGGGGGGQRNTCGGFVQAQIKEN